MTEKVVNYTKEQTEALVKIYGEAENDEQRKAVVAGVAKNLRKTEASVRAKLVSEGVYVKMTPVRKRKAKKAELVTILANTLGLDEEVIGSFETATANALTKVIGAVGRIKYEAENAE